MQKLYDTPGVHLHHRLAAVVQSEDLPALAPQSRLRGQHFPVCRLKIPQWLHCLASASMKLNFFLSDSSIANWRWDGKQGLKQWVEWLFYLLGRSCESRFIKGLYFSYLKCFFSSSQEWYFFRIWHLSLLLTGSTRNMFDILWSKRIADPHGSYWKGRWILSGNLNAVYNCKKQFQD